MSEKEALKQILSDCSPKMRKMVLRFEHLKEQLNAAERDGNRNLMMRLIERVSGFCGELLMNLKEISP